MGRLDVDTTGLLLLTDDGKFAHTITSPKHLKSKVYHVTCKHALEDRYPACNAFVLHVFCPAPMHPVGGGGDARFRVWFTPTAHGWGSVM